MDGFFQFLNKIKVPISVIAFVVCLFSGILMFSSDSFIDILHLNTIKDECGPAFGLSFVISLVILISYLMDYILKKIKFIILFKKMTKLRHDYMTKLSSEEYTVIILMYASDSRSYRLSPSDATFQLLSSKQIIDFPSITGMYGLFDCFLQPWVVEYITNNIERYSVDIEKAKVRLANSNDDGLFYI